MLSWIIQITIISIILIFLVHYLINFFTSTLTVPKIKDLVNTPTQRYDSMFNVIANASTGKTIMYNTDDLLPSQSSTTSNNDEKTDMKNELKNFLKKQMNVSSSSTDISSLGAFYN
jgi:cell shape-determining protein MreC